MGKDDFLKLLVAQLQNQDPLNPADATEFTAQLAQFSQLEQLSNMNTKLDNFAGMSSQIEKQSALGLMGAEVVVQSSQFETTGGQQSLGYRLDTPADRVELFVLNSNGYNVATLSANGTSSGDHFVDWDGTSDLGQPVTPGTYSLVARAVDADDKTLESTSLIRSIVSGVEMAADQTSLTTAAGTFSMAKVERVVGATL
ncbi:MAG: flagellar hook assembly protein FlgD [Geopsychrobacter sp.]|nr:flagellar hook assembly protein FlgD [Geopsychrobacter sp.]